MDQIKFVEPAFKKFEVIWSTSADHITSSFLKAAFHKFYLVHSWILGLKWDYIITVLVLLISVLLFPPFLIVSVGDGFGSIFMSFW